MIVHTLYTNHIPFCYECALHLGTKTVYPDFTILHPQTYKIYYWEHFGKMDNTHYAQSTASKLQLYIANQIIPSLQLITIFETSEAPLTYDVIQRVLETHFL